VAAFFLAVVAFFFTVVVDFFLAEADLLLEAFFALAFDFADFDFEDFADRAVAFDFALREARADRDDRAVRERLRAERERV
jgi:hypothetical protein